MLNRFLACYCHQSGRVDVTIERGGGGGGWSGIELSSAAAAIGPADEPVGKHAGFHWIETHLEIVVLKKKKERKVVDGSSPLSLNWP